MYSLYFQRMIFLNVDPNLNVKTLTLQVGNANNNTHFLKHLVNHEVKRLAGIMGNHGTAGNHG